MSERPGAGPVSDGSGDGWPRVDRAPEEGTPEEGAASEHPVRAAADDHWARSDGATGRPSDADRAASSGSKELGDDWKRSALEDFRQWLDELAEEAPPGDDEPEECDLHDLFAELAALRQEVRLQNREQSKASRELASAAAGYDAAVLAAERRDEELADLERRVSRSAEDRVLRSTLEVRDALVRGRAAVTELRGRSWLGRVSSRRLAGVAEGYEQALRRFDRVLAGFGVRIVPAAGHPFDSRTMHAVEARRDERAPDGTVVEELRSGFTRDGEVLRLADVAVSRREARE